MVLSVLGRSARSLRYSRDHLHAVLGGSAAVLRIYGFLVGESRCSVYGVREADGRSEEWRAHSSPITSHSEKGPLG